MKDATPKSIKLVDYRPPAFIIDDVDLDIDLRDQGTRVRAKLALRRNPDGPGGPLVLDGEGLDPVWVRLDGNELPASHYRTDDVSLTVFEPPEVFLLESEVMVAPESNTALEGLYRSAGLFCTQCEPEGFRKITWFIDRPDVMARFRVRVEADRASCPVLLSNGNPVEEGECPNGRHYALWDDPFPKPSYLFALVAGDLRFVEEGFTTASGRDVRLRIYVEPENIDKCGHAMQSLVRSMRWDEENYGREYDLDVFNIVAVNDFNMGAMENKGLNIFNAKFVLASAETATDADFLGIEGVIAHEYFHNWTGNRITCRDWFQLSLKEGFTVFRDQSFSADMGARGIKRIEDVQLLRTHQFPEDAGPMAHPVRPASYIEINNFYTMTVYEKGAEVVRMQANLLGSERFRAATDLYFERHDGQAVTTEDFLSCMADTAGEDLSQMQHWYDYAGTPTVTATGEYDGAAATYTLTLEQSTPDTPGQTDKPPFLIPVVTALMGGSGEALSVGLGPEGAPAPGHTLRFVEARQRFVFHGVNEEPVPSLLRGFSAPVKLDLDLSDEQLMFLMRHDSDGFNRWDAAQTLMRSVLLDLCTGSTAAKQRLKTMIAAIGDVLGTAEKDPALVAEMLSLPTISYLGDFLPVVDVDGLHRARKTLMQRVGAALLDELTSLYGHLEDHAAYAPEPEAIARRSLKNRVLGFLHATRSEATDVLAEGQYRAQHNMTDVMAALALIADSDVASRPQVLADFEQRWRNDPLVLDKWFAVQARAARTDTLMRIHALMQHPGFSLRNPNRVRALVGTFVSGNPVCFHAADGSGYEFLGDQVLALDPMNPMVAARLLRALSRWRRYDDERQAAMQQVLQRVSAAKVSKDVYEIASKSLESA